MRKLILAAVGATALATASMASATITVTSSTGVDSATVVNSLTKSTIDWTKNPEPSGTFAGSVSFNNDLAGLYSIIVGTSTPGALITSVSLAGTGGTYSATGPAVSVSLLQGGLPVGNYTVSFNGTMPADGGVATGNLTFIPGVPEPATWAMMLVGFLGIGFAMRRRQQPALTQVA